MSCIVHIGTHKTGTTAFQTYLASNASHLEGQNLAYYQSADGGFQAHELAMLVVRPELTIPIRARRPDDTLNEAKLGMAERIEHFLAQNEGKNVVFSHEALSLVRTRDEAERLRELVGPDTNIVVTLRNPADYLRSWRAQLRGMGHDCESAYRSSFMYTELDSWLVDYTALVSAYSQVFGEDNVVVLSFETEVERWGSIIPGLAAACGLDPDRLPEGWDMRRNASPKPKAKPEALDGLPRRMLPSSFIRVGKSLVARRHRR